MPTLLLPVAVMASVAIVAGSASAQVAATPPPSSTGSDQTPVFHVT